MNFRTVLELIAGSQGRAEDLGAALMLFEPEAPFGGRGAVTVLVTTASLITLALLSGMALTALLVLLIGLSLILLILTRVLGIDFDLSPEEIFGYRP